ncbi:MAG TPA: molybdenum ABC transporter ATP-binding protein [Methylomirabilota bacterium]|nr:molybdenum ABC transporter ATP-binding protein [Methylomirabilota bacterium]
MGDRGLAVMLRQAGPIPLDVAFGCEPGQVLAIFGPSGSGKTTILRSIAGLYTPAEGQVRVGGETWLDTATERSVPVHRRAVGVVFQEYALFPHLTALGNVRTALGHLPRVARRRRAQELLALVHLAGHGDRHPAALSGGERQRLALARALAREPAVLLLDEPFAAVDRAVRLHLQDEIDQIRRSLDIPLILVTHDFDDVVRLGTHLLLLDQGRTVAVGPLQGLTSRPDLTWLHETAGLGSLLEATVVRVDVSRGLAELAFEGGTLVAPSHSLTEGRRVRLRIPAREVILATERPRGLSLHNALSGQVSGMHADAQSGHVIVQVAVGGVRLLAEVTPDAVARLGIVVGLPLHALVKSVSLDVRATTATAVR